MDYHYIAKTLIANFSVVVLCSVHVEDFSIVKISHVAIFAQFSPQKCVVDFGKKFHIRF